MKNHFLPICLLAIIFLYGCDLIEYHPYDGHITGTTNVNARNITRIEELCNNKDTIRFAVISDTQGYYDHTKDCIKSINNRNDIDFVLHTGDLTDYGATKEFIWQRDIFEKLEMPYTCIIGNHDCIGNGEEIYKKIFGDFNYSFRAGNTRFVCLNTNALEFDYSERVPDFIYIEEMLSTISSEQERTIVAMHARPYSEQFGDNLAKVFQLYISQFPNLQFCLYGHGHNFREDDFFDDGIIYYECTTTGKRGYYVFTLTPNKYEYEKIYY